MSAGFYGYLMHGMAFDSLRPGVKDPPKGVIPVAVKLDKNEYRDFERGGSFDDKDAKILFVDFDGVLTDSSCGMDYAAWGNPRKYGISRLCLKHLRRICEATGAKVIIASNWRRVKPDADKYGMPNPLPVVRKELGELCAGFLPDATGHHKPVAVREWLDGHPEFKGRFVIFDDYAREGFADSEFKDQYLKTDGGKGLTSDIADRAIRMLTDKDSVKSAEQENKETNEEGQIATAIQ